MANTHSIDLEAGSSQYLTANDSASLSPTGAMSVEAWVKLESLPANNSSFRVVSKGYDGNVDRSYTFDIVHEGGVRYIAFSNSAAGSGGGTAQVTWTPSTATWYHIAATYATSSGTVKFYVDGSQQGTTQTGNPTSIFNGTSTCAIGNNSSGTDVFFDGLIDEVRIWSATRSDSEIADNRSTELVGNETNLNAYWKLNNDLTDSTANSNTLTNNGSATFSTDVPFSGAVGPANVKTYNGLASASVKTVNGLAIASVKTFNGLA